MKEDILKVEGLSKMYKLGDINTGTLSHDLNRWWSRMRRKEDPYQKLAATNDRSAKSDNSYVWSLKDINFSVARGEVFGIVGKNGAGKSTLLKLLSKITKPTEGTISIDGRIGSLLEVGTGFHPDLSGRENIFLNGAILGMRKHEIKKRFDEIVDFSGIERYIDTPVKRYSSGMFVRLAFAVAAHLEPEILIIDEVLAVGDAEFQQKCLGKMREVSQQQGRTVFFVSHNMVAVRHLCTRALLLEQGRTSVIGSVDKVLEAYQIDQKDNENGIRNKVPDNGRGHFLSWQLEGQTPSDPHTCYSREDFFILFRFCALDTIAKCELNFRISSQDGTNILFVNSSDFFGGQFHLNPGEYQFRVRMNLPVSRGKYDLDAGLFASTWIDNWRPTTKLSVLDTFEGHGRDNSVALLNVITEFSIDHL
ncbi:MAG TPA: ABC transporter ATP-binding protein [Puia sp.]|nr:ABC transporter ATP-binding protein [Puia sp.]